MDTLTKAILLGGGALAIHAATRGARHAPRSVDLPRPIEIPPIEIPPAPTPPSVPSKPKLKLAQWKAPPKSVVPYMYQDAHLIDRGEYETDGVIVLEWEVYRTHGTFIADLRPGEPAVCDNVLMFRNLAYADWVPFAVSNHDGLLRLEYKIEVSNLYMDALDIYYELV